MKMVIGLTGGIASGKSTVVDFLISEGYQVIDADKVVRQLQEPGGKLFNVIMETFGSDFTDENGKLNRSKIECFSFF
ncbi:Dephospho-CoA kinase [Lactococcus lactis]|nr:Dephospho-CoA kinase [Lactococcus lactis]